MVTRGSREKLFVVTASSSKLSRRADGADDWPSAAHAERVSTASNRNREPVGRKVVSVVPRTLACARYLKSIPLLLWLASDSHATPATEVHRVMPLAWTQGRHSNAPLRILPQPLMTFD